LASKLLLLLDSLARSSTVESAPGALQGMASLALTKELSRYVNVVAAKLSQEAPGAGSDDFDEDLDKVRTPALQALSSLAVALAGAAKAIEPYALIARFGQAVARIRRGGKYGSHP